MAAVESNYNASEMLTEVNNAIYAVLVGGQDWYETAHPCRP
jgi:hypothetical protein